MTQEILDFDHMQPLEKLKKIVGSLDECKRLGFVHIDGQGVQSLTAVGLGFLIYIVARDVKNLPEAFAAGWQAAIDHETD